MKKLAVIPARGGSKRIKKKNIKEFCGKPIISYSIDSALKSNIFDTVMVSTDDEEIASIARRCGANVPFYRSEKNSDDYATTYDVLEEVIRNYQQRDEYFDMVACIYPTAPFLNYNIIQNAFQAFDYNSYSSLMSVTKFSFPIQRAVFIEGNRLFYREKEFITSRSQDLTEFYHDAGQFYFILTEELLKSKSLVTDYTFPFILPEIMVQDIDNLSDWEIAEFKYNYLKGKGELHE